MTERLCGSFKAGSLSNGSPLAPYYGSTENVRFCYYCISGERLLTDSDYLSGLWEKRHLVRFSYVTFLLRLILC